MLLQSPIPAPPSSKDAHSPQREAAAILALQEAWARVSALIEFLDDYEPTSLLTADGRSMEVLAIDMGEGDVPDRQFPFQLIDASDEEGAKVRVRWGRLNDAMPPGMSFGDDPPFILDVGTGNAVYCTAAMDYNTSTGFWSESSVAVVMGSASAPPPTDDTSFAVQIGTLSFDGDGNMHIAQSVSLSLGHRRCGNDTIYTDDTWGV